MTGNEWFLVAGAIALICSGLLGVVVPGIPGMPLIFAGGWCVAAAGGYQHLGTGSLIVLGVLAVIGVAVDWLAQSLGASRAGASRLAVFGSVIGTFAGVLTGLWGLVFFPFVGAVIGELLAEQDVLRAGKVGLATWLGMAIGAAVKVALAVSMVAIIVVMSLL